MASGSLVVPGFFVISCISLLCVRHIEAAVYTVGDDDEWSLEVDYDEWSQKYNFTVGDTLGMKFGLNLLGANKRITNQTTESPSSAPLPSPSGANNHGLTQPTILLVILLILINSLF